MWTSFKRADLTRGNGQSRIRNCWGGKGGRQERREDPGGGGQASFSTLGGATRPLED